MPTKIQLNEMTLNRANELRIRHLVCKMLNATNNNFGVITKYIKHLAQFIDFNEEIIINIMREVIDIRFEPTVNELIKINVLFGLTIREIADRLNMKESTVKMHIYRNKNNINTILIYPRLKKEQSQELRKFLKQYYSLYVPANKI